MSAFIQGSEGEMPTGKKQANCMEKILEIPLMKTVKNSVGELYYTIKTKNKLCTFGLNMVETSCGIVAWGLTPLKGPLRGPFDLVDAMACLVLDEVKHKYPVLLEPTDKVIESSTSAVLHTSLAKNTLFGVEKLLSLAEAVITLVPSVVIEEETDADETIVSKVLKPVRICYSTATWPLRYTTNFIQAKRSYIQNVSKGYLSSPSDKCVEPKIHARRKVSPRKRLPAKGMAEHIFFIPRFFLQALGRATCERSERRIALELYSGNEPNFNISADEKKRKFECLNSDDYEEEDECNDDGLSVLDQTLDDDSSVNDADYVPEEVDTDSFEYHSDSYIDDKCVFVDILEEDKESTMDEMLSCENIVEDEELSSDGLLSSADLLSSTIIINEQSDTTQDEEHIPNNDRRELQNVSGIEE